MSGTFLAALLGPDALATLDHVAEKVDVVGEAIVEWTYPNMSVQLTKVNNHAIRPPAARTRAADPLALKNIFLY